MEAYGNKLHFRKAESTYFELQEARCIPTEHTYALLLKTYCKCGLVEHAEAVFAEMRKNGFPPSMSRFYPWSGYGDATKNFHTFLFVYAVSTV